MLWSRRSRVCTEMPLLFCSFPIEPSRPAQRRTPSGDNMFFFKQFKVSAPAARQSPNGHRGRRGSPRPLRGRQVRGDLRRSYALSRGSETAAENDRILRSLRGGCRVQSTPRFPVRRRRKPERPPYAAALTLFSGVRSSDVSAPQAGKIRITAVHTLLFIILYAVIIARPKAFCNFFRAFCVFGF